MLKLKKAPWWRFMFANWIMVDGFDPHIEVAHLVEIDDGWMLRIFGLYIGSFADRGSKEALLADAVQVLREWHEGQLAIIDR